MHTGILRIKIGVYKRACAKRVGKWNEEMHVQKMVKKITADSKQMSRAKEYTYITNKYTGCDMPLPYLFTRQSWKERSEVRSCKMWLERKEERERDREEHTVVGHDEGVSGLRIAGWMVLAAVLLLHHCTSSEYFLMPLVDKKKSYILSISFTIHFCDSGIKGEI